MSKADFQKIEVYGRYLIVPVRCEESGLWTASWLDEDNLPQMQGGIPIDFSYPSPEAAIAALKSVLDRYTSPFFTLSYRY